MKLFGISIGKSKEAKPSVSPKKSKSGKVVKGKSRGDVKPDSTIANDPDSPSYRRRAVSAAVLQKRSDKMVSSMGDMPKYISLARSGKQNVGITDRDKDNFIVLVISEEDKKCALLISSKRMEIPLDKSADHIVATMRRDGWTVIQKRFIEHSLIGDIYAADDKKSLGSGDQSAIEKEFDEIVRYACDNKISDIHIEVREHSAKVRIRRNSLLEDYRHFGVEYATEFCRTVYQVLSETESKDVSFLPRKQQSSVIQRDIAGHGQIRIRLNTIPATGFDMVLRILPSDSGKKLTLAQLGYNEKLMRSIKLASSKPIGALIIAGTTGSGKSTTLKTLLESKVDQFSTVNGLSIKIITVEDPPEYEIKNVSQSNVSTSRAGDEGSKNPFGQAIKAAMRCDPDILMAGEVRDEDSAELLMHITLSGHQVMTTIHASSAISIVARLRNNGIPNDALGNSDFLSGLVYQKLVPLACQECSLTLDEYAESSDLRDEELIRRIDQVIPDSQRGGLRFRRAEGCEACRAGVVGQTVVAEVIIPDHTMLDYFLNGQDNKAWHHHKKTGGDTIIDHALEKIVTGVCDPRDIEVKIGLITMDMVMEDAVFEQSEMEKHGLQVEKAVFKRVSWDSLNDVRKAKAKKAHKAILKLIAEDKIIGAQMDIDFVAIIMENGVYGVGELQDGLQSIEINVDETELDYVLNTIKPLLR